MKSRAELDVEWRAAFERIEDHEEFDERMDLARRVQSLLAAERAYVDREVAAKAIRWADKHSMERHEEESERRRRYPSSRPEFPPTITELAGSIERGELKVPP